MTTKRSMFPSVALPMLLLATASSVSAQSIEDEVVRTATAVLDEVMAIPARQIPRHLLATARGVAIIPGVVKGGFVVGVRHGRGVLLIKNDNGQWTPPAFMSITGGSVGWQAGIQSTDVVLVFRTRKSLTNLLNGELTIGVDAAGAAGPVGRQASAGTDARLSAEILSYSRSRGLFAGVSFDGSVLRIDHASGVNYYGAAGPNPASMPASAVQLVQRLRLYSGGTQVAPPPLTASPVSRPQIAAQSAESVRARLAASWQQLAALLDERWKEYLAIPASLTVPEGGENLNTIAAVLQRYTTVASSSQYAALTGRPEFKATYHLLREYLRLKSAEGKLPLPPPPASTPNTGDRY